MKGTSSLNTNCQTPKDFGKEEYIGRILIIFGYVVITYLFFRIGSIDYEFQKVISGR